MAIGLADAEDRPQIDEGRIVAEVVKRQQRVILQSQLGVFPSPSAQRIEDVLFVQVIRQLPVEVLKIFF